MSAASWRKVALKALGLGLATLAAAVAVGLYRHQPFQLGKPAMIAGGILAAFQLVSGILKERGWVTASRLVFVVPVVAFFGLDTFRDISSVASSMTELERAPLVAVGEAEGRRLRHPTLGFSIRDPGPDFTLTAAPDFGGTAQYRAYKNAAGNVILFLGLLKGTGESEASLRDWLSSMKDLLAGNTSQRLDVTGLDVSGGARPIGRLHGWIRGPTGESSYRLHANGFSKDGTSYIFFVAVASAEPDALADVLTSFER